MPFTALPGVTDRLPGVPVEYFPTQAALQVQELAARTTTAAWSLLALLLVIALLCGQFGLLARLKTTPGQILLRLVLVAGLLSGFPMLFGVIFSVGDGFARLIFKNDDFASLNESFHAAAQKARDDKSEATAFLDRVAGVVATLTPLPALMDVVRGAVMIAFLAVGVLYQLLWRALLMVAYLAGPLCIALGMLPGFGPRILTSWIAALIHLSAWQVWGAWCAFMVKSADGFFTLYTDLAAGRPGLSNDMESIAVALLFVILYASGPAVIAKLIPISNFGQVVGGAVTAGVGAIAAAGLKVAQIAVGGAVGGPMGALAGSGLLPTGAGRFSVGKDAKGGSQ
jgi:hypothetical protein